MDIASLIADIEGNPGKKAWSLEEYRRIRDDLKEHIQQIHADIDESYERWSDHYGAYRAVGIILSPPLALCGRVERTGQFLAYWDHYRDYWRSLRIPADRHE